jgi:hypothetical protein
MSLRLVQSGSTYLWTYRFARTACVHFWARRPISSEMMTIDEYMHALERAWSHALPGPTSVSLPKRKPCFPQRLFTVGS